MIQDSSALYGAGEELIKLHLKVLNIKCVVRMINENLTHYKQKKGLFLFFLENHRM